MGRSLRSGREPLTLLVPGDVDRPTGGNVWDRCVRDALVAAGVDVRWRPVRAGWPVPPDGPDALEHALGEVPDGGAVLVDGLLLCAWPDVARRHAGRVRLSVVVHLPLALESGLDLAEAERLATAEEQVLHAVALSGAVLTTSRWCAVRVRGGLDGVQPVVAVPGTTRAPTASPVRDSGFARLLGVGSLTSRKGHDVLLEALGDVGDGWQLRLVGPAPDPAHAAALRTRAADLARSGVVVELPGPAEGAALEEHYGWADLLVVPSRQETYGMVVGEALVRGLPCLVTAGTGLVEALGTVGGATPGLVVPPEDPAALAEALRRWREGPDLRARLRALARDRGDALARHGWDACADVVRRAVLAA
ncbi:glycosyltransferase family 4 protein [Aquipuribacter sp. SD81]|uniref:glycosyltransferase family 4 protein n=1 Tax=Aquipuribacter sp. SD81 TaxID=3127703 RepID=UPI0030185164